MPKSRTSEMLRGELTALKTETKFPSARAITMPDGEVIAPKKGDLRTAQIRILKALQEAGGAVTKARICEICAPTFPTARKHTAWMTDPLGGKDEKARAIAESKCGYLSLLTLGYVVSRVETIEDQRELVYEITAEGLAALAAL